MLGSGKLYAAAISSFDWIKDDIEYHTELEVDKYTFYTCRSEFVKEFEKIILSPWSTFILVYMQKEIKTAEVLESLVIVIFAMDNW